jgi:hypothetical protein
VPFQAWFSQTHHHTKPNVAFAVSDSAPARPHGIALGPTAGRRLGGQDQVLVPIAPYLSVLGAPEPIEEACDEKVSNLDKLSFDSERQKAK